MAQNQATSNTGNYFSQGYGILTDQGGLGSYVNDWGRIEQQSTSPIYQYQPYYATVDKTDKAIKIVKKLFPKVVKVKQFLELVELTKKEL